MPSPQPPASASAAVTPLVCESAPGGGRQQCPADTSKGVALTRSTGSGECILGRTWGYDQVSIWVSEGCGGEFLVGAAAVAAAAQATAAPNGDGATDPLIETLGRIQPRYRFPGRQKQSGRAGDQRLRAGALHQPDARRAGVHRSPGEHALGRWPQRHLPAPGDGLLQGLARHPEADLLDDVLDRARHQPERHLRQRRLSVPPEVQPLRRPQRQPGDPLAAGQPSAVAGQRPRDGRRVLPAVLRLRRLGPGRSGARSLVQRDAEQHQQHPRRQVEPARSQVDHRRVDVVDADDERVRPQGRLRRLGSARRRGDPIRRLVDAEPRAAVHRRPHGWSGKHHAQAGRQRERVRDRRAGARRHGATRWTTRSWRSMPA